MDIIIKDICIKYGKKQVLNHFSAIIKENTITCVMAPSGEGKTTLLRILSGLEKADQGSIRGVKGCKISMVFQEDRLCENLNAVNNIKLVCDKDVSRDRIMEELWAVGLRGSEIQPVRELSGGMKRRVVLVRALMAAYDILILDEPYKGLDEKAKKEVMDYTKRKSINKTVIFVTHNEEEAQYMGGTILCIGSS